MFSRPVAELIEEPHFQLVLLACPSCDQRYVSVFTETVDWADGADRQHWSLLPVIAAEAAALLPPRKPPTKATLEALGRAGRGEKEEESEGSC